MLHTRPRRDRHPPTRTGTDPRRDDLMLTIASRR